MKYTINNPHLLTDSQLRRKQGKIATRVFSNSFLGLVGYTIVSSIAVITIAVVMALVLDEDTMNKITSSEYFAMGMQMITMYVIALPAFFAFIRPIPTRRVVEGEISFSDFMRLFSISMFFIYVGKIISTLLNVYVLSGDPIATSSLSILEDEILSAPNILTVAVVVVIGPIAEELIFRKALIDRLGKYGEKMALIISSVAFGVFHGNFDQLFYATLIGFICGFVYIKTGRLVFSCIIHMLINFFGTVPHILLSSVTSDISDTDTIMALLLSEDTPAHATVGLGLLALAAVFTVFGFIALIKSSSSGVFDYEYKTEIELSPWRKLRCAILNIGVIVFILLCISTFLSYYQVITL